MCWIGCKTNALNANLSRLNAINTVTKVRTCTRNPCVSLTTLRNRDKPFASEVLTCYLQQCNEPPWTSYFVKYSSIQNDQWGWSHFNWKVGNSNYHILRTGCYPYIKYHCTRRPYQDLTVEDRFFRIIKVINLGIPCLAYGIAATLLIRHQEIVHTPHGDVLIYFLYKEDKGSQY